MRAVAGEEGGKGLLRLRCGAFLIDEVVGLVAVGTVVGVAGVGTETVGVDVEVDVLGELALATDAGVGGDAYELIGGLIRDDVDDTPDSIRAVERRGRTVEHLDALDAAHIDARQVDVTRDVAREFLAVDEDEQVFIAQSVHAEEGTHGTGRHGHLREHSRHGVLEGGDALFLELALGEGADRSGRSLEALVVACAGDNYGVQVV